MGASELRFRSGPSLPQADECQTHHLKVSAQLLLLCVSSLTEWQTQDSLALKKKILSAKIPKEKELAASPTPFLFPKPKQGIPPFLPLSDKFESKIQSGEHHAESAYFLLMFDRNQD